MMGILGDRLKAWLQEKLSDYPPEWLNDRDRLADWAFAHSVSSGIWAVTPAYGTAWRLWPPGSIRQPDGSIDGEPAAEWPVADGEDDQPVWLRDVECWMRPWIEDVSGGRVLEMVEGLTWFPGGAACDYEYTIYARVMS